VTTIMLERPAGSAAVLEKAPQLRRATSTDAAAIHALITRHQSEGRLLPRTLDEVARQASRFVIVEDAFGLAGCGELMPLGPLVAEVRSLVVADRCRGAGIGRLVVDALVGDALGAGYQRLCAFTHEPGFFARLGFSLVPHAWLPEKISADCGTCPLFRRCGQTAMERRLHGSASVTDVRRVA
jgi:amino-acid N-acetyltransferase